MKDFLAKTEHLWTRRWLLVLIGLGVQLCIILLLLVSATRPTVATVKLEPVPGRPAICRIDTISLLSEAWIKGVQPGTLVRKVPATATDSTKLENCQLQVGGVLVETVDSQKETTFTIYVENTVFDPLDVVISGILAFIFSITGITIFLRAEDRQTARVAYSLFYAVSLMFCLFNAHSYNIPWVELLIFSSMMMSTGLSTTFVCLFPYPNHSHFIERDKASLTPYTPTIAGCLLLLIAIVTVIFYPTFTKAIFLATIFYSLCCLIVVIWVLFWGIRRVERNERQITRVVMIGVAFLLVIIAISQGITPPDPSQHGFIPSDPFTHKSLMRLIPLPLVVLPIICDYALFRKQLLGTTSLISRQVMRILLWILLASLFILPAIILLRSLDSNNTPQELRDYCYTGLLALSLIVFPLLWNKVRDLGDHVFYHDFYQYNLSLGELSTELTNLQGLEQISAFLLPRLSQLLNAPEVALLVRAISQDEIRYNTDNNYETTRFWHLYRTTQQTGLLTERLTKTADLALTHITQRSHEPLLIGDVLLLALYDSEKVSGFLCLGAKKNREPYNRQDKSFLATLAAQLSILEVNNRYLVQAQKNAQQMAALSHRIISAQEAERRHLALDLHDDVLQEAMLLVRQLSDASTMSDVGDTMPLARSVVTNLRRTCLALRPSLLDEMGLTEALRWLARQTEQLSNQKVQVEISYVGPTQRDFSTRFSTDVELAFYRVAQEAFTNIIKHAQASRVILRLCYSRHGEISLLIIDNGQGFRRGRMATESLGIVGMHERMAAIGGGIQLRTSPGRGVVVRATYTPHGVALELPYAEADRRENIMPLAAYS